MKARRTSTSSAETAARFRARFERRVGPPTPPPAGADATDVVVAIGFDLGPEPPATAVVHGCVLCHAVLTASDDPAAVEVALAAHRLTCPGSAEAVQEPSPASALPAAGPVTAQETPPDPAPAATADQPAQPAQPAELAPGIKHCARCRVRPAIEGRPGPARCTECTNTPPGAAETCSQCSRCGRKLPRTPTAHYVDGQRVCRRCDPPPQRLRGRQRNRFYRNDTPRARTISRAQLRRQVLAAAVEPSTPLDIPRPKTWGECREQARPCPYVGCRHHLYLDVNPESGSIKMNYPDLEPWELKHTCSLDVAERGGITLEEVGEIVNLTRERIRQVEVRGLLKLKIGSPSPDEFGADLLAAARASELLP